jgi:Tripartite tricarboxylate transporter TctB family.
MSIRNPKDFWAGLIYVVLGLAAVYIAQDYEMGTATRMGPGYFPTLLGGFLALIGVVSLVRSFYVPREPVGALALKATLLICGATLLFGLMLRGAGMIVSMIVMLLISSYASVRFRLVPAVLLAVGITAFCALVFVRGLGVPMPLVGSWFGG